MVIDQASELALRALYWMLFAEPRMCVLIALLSAATVFDVRTLRIPNWLTGGGLAFSLAHSLISQADAPNLAAAMSGMTIGFLGMLPMYKLRSLGAGDVKLMAMIGAFLGPQGVMYTIVSSVVLAGAGAIVFAARHGVLGRLFGNVRIIMTTILWPLMCGVRPLARIEPDTSIGSLAFGANITVGTVGVVVAQHYRLL